MKIPKKLIMYIERNDNGFVAFSDTYKIEVTGRTQAEVMGKAFDAVEKRFGNSQNQLTLSDSDIEIEFH